MTPLPMLPTLVVATRTKETVLATQDQIEAVSELLTAHELGAQVANELIMRAILSALRSMAGEDGADLIATIRRDVEEGLEEASVGKATNTALFQKSGSMVVASVFDNMTSE